MMAAKPMLLRRRRLSKLLFVIPITVFAALCLFLVISLRSIEPYAELRNARDASIDIVDRSANATLNGEVIELNGDVKKCATVEEMGEIFEGNYAKESLRVRRIIQDHFALNGASRVRDLQPEEFCRHGFVIAKASEAGLGNELYKILTAAALSVMLNRSLIIGQTRGRYPFEDYIMYSNMSFTLQEVKHLWRQNRCLVKYGRHLIMRIDDFQKPTKTNVLCDNWRKWEEPIIWFQNTTDAVAAQFFLKNVHFEMREAASNLFGKPDKLQHRGNVFGELMRVLIFPSRAIESAVDWALRGSGEPDIALHLRMMMNRSVRAKRAAFDCLKKNIGKFPVISKPIVVLISDTPSMIKDIAPDLEEFAEVLHFDHKNFTGITSKNTNKFNSLNFRTKDWGPEPRWVAFVDFFLAARVKHAVISGAHRRVGTTYAQLIAALAAASNLDDKSSHTNSSFTFLSSFQSNLLTEGLKIQIGWGHVWNRFAGPLSCHGQANQCAVTPLLAPAWWDGLWQSPIARDIQRMEAYGIKLSGFGTFDVDYLNHFCRVRKSSVMRTQII